MVFQQSRVKTISTSVKNARRKWNGEKARAFLLQLEKCTKKLKQFKGTKQEKKRSFAKSSSEQEHRVNALASGADEGRDKLR